MKVWTGKRSDIFIVLSLFLFFVFGVHILSSISWASKRDLPIADELFSAWNFLAGLALFTVIMSPFGVYFTKVPRRISIDPVNRKLILERKRSSKSGKFDLDRIAHCVRYHSFYTTLEIYASFETSRDKNVVKRVRTIIVPNRGLSWNKSVIDEIDKFLLDLNVPHYPAKSRPFWDYIYD